MLFRSYEFCRDFVQIFGLRESFLSQLGPYAPFPLLNSVIKLRKGFGIYIYIYIYIFFFEKQASEYWFEESPMVCFSSSNGPLN